MEKNTGVIYKEILRDLKFSFLRFLKYQILAKLFIVLLIFPIIKYILLLLMNKSGYAIVTNKQLLKFGLSVQGVLSSIIIIFIVLITILLEIGGLIVIAHQAHNREKESSFIQILIFLASKIKKLIGIGSLALILGIIIIAPFLDSIFDSEFQNVKVPGFIEDFIVHNTALNIAYNVLFVIGIIIAVLSIFTLHIVLFEDMSITAAVKKSALMVVKNFKVFIKELIFAFGKSILFLVAIIGLYTAIAAGIIYLLLARLGIWVLAALAVVGVLLVIILLSIAVPEQILVITKIYYILNGSVPQIDIKVKNSKSFLRKIGSAMLLLILLAGYCGYEVFSIMNEHSPAIWASTGVFAQRDKISRTLVTAHRGSSREAPENTIAALKVAISHKADFAELDAQETKDGRVVITHNSNFKRTARVNKNLWEMNFDEVRNLDVGSRFSSKFKGEKVPTLEEYIDAAKGKIKLNIEIKLHGHNKELVKSVVKIIDDKNFVDSCVVTSVDYNSLLEVKRLNPKIKTGYIAYVALGDISKLNVDFYSVEETNITSDFLKTAHRLGRQVHAWTINKEEDMDKMIDLGVDNIITDNDTLAIETIQSKLDDENQIDNFITKLFNKLINKQ
jgi:glycerophosphoryl diester phosphodiesterase